MSGLKSKRTESRASIKSSVKFREGSKLSNKVSDSQLLESPEVEKKSKKSKSKSRLRVESAEGVISEKQKLPDPDLQAEINL
jgi:hypothetical protein